MNFLKNIFWVICIAFTLRACVFEPVRSSDNSMAPTILAGDVILVSKLSYGIRLPGAGSIVSEWHSIHRGDLVVAGGVGDPPQDLLRRVTALPGDTVSLPEEKTPRVLGAGEYFLSADQKDSGMDSRQLGIISRRAIIGRAEYIWLPSENASSAAETQVKSNGQHRRFLQPIL